MVIPILRYSGSQKVKSVARDVIVGEPLPHGSTIMTGANSEADLLLTTGSLAKVGPNSKLVLSVFWQKDFRASAKKVTDLKEETSPSRVVLKLEMGNLVVDVKRLNKESSFTIESELGVAGIRGTQFGISAGSDTIELAVLEGRVGFLDANQKAQSVNTSQKIAGSQDGAGKVNALPESEKAELTKSVNDSQELASEYDLTRLANTVDGYAPKQNHIVKSALNMELIWCPPGSFIMGPSGNDDPAHPVILTKGFYLGKFEVTQEEYEKVMGNNPSEFVGDKLPVEDVSWENAFKFCEILNKKERTPRGWVYTLPTEAQWEYACRAETTSAYSWGDLANPLLGNFQASGLDKTAQVGSYKSNPWGFFDMHGNVSEWCYDRYGPYPSTSISDPTGLPEDEPLEAGHSAFSRLRRGGAWDETTGTSSRRSGNYQFYSSSNFGFRLCLAPAR
jgi:formylglycine-generating enzyme required for sulfatase activity